ncbi:MAG: ABC transporter permease [Lysobacteraceae bacterium]|nr:MAG: ABC transporter permease [Xanthomonadaceae bacterium]
MKTLLTVAHKELVDLFRDRRTVMLGLLLMPFLFPALLLGTSAMAEKKARTQLEEALKLPVIGAEHAPNLIAHLKSNNIQPLPAPKDPDAAVRAQTYDAVLKISPDFGAHWRDSRTATIEIIYDSSRQDAQIPVERIRATVQVYARQLGALRLVQRGVSPEIARPVQIAQRDAATPESKRGMILGLMLPYLLILSSFLGGSYLVIDVTAGERERQSLEPLLATPAARTAIMSGKILAACAFAMLSLVLILVAFKLSLMFAPGRLRMMTLAVPVLAQMLLVLLPMVLIGTTLLTLISASVKSVKEAQSYMSVLMLLPMVPTVMLMVNPVKQQLWQFAVPFLCQNQLLLKLLRSEPISAEIWATYLASGLGLGIVLWLLAARLYHKEKLAISA